MHHRQLFSIGPFAILDTVPEEGKFRMILGTFLPDVDLINITAGSAVMTVSQAAANGFDIQQHIFPNGSIAFSLEVPFTQPAVIKEVCINPTLKPLPDMNVFRAKWANPVMDYLRCIPHTTESQCYNDNLHAGAGVCLSRSTRGDCVLSPCNFGNCRGR